MGGLTIALILAFLGWVAWAMPMHATPEDAPVDGPAFWYAVGIALIASSIGWAVRRIARKAKGRRRGHF